MKKFSKLLIVILTLAVMCLGFVVMANATDSTAPEDEIITVGVTVNPTTSEAYTLEDAWTYAEAATDRKVEVVQPVTNDNFYNLVQTAKVANKTTTIQLTENVTNNKAFALEKGANLTIDVSGYTLSGSLYFSINGIANASITFRTTTAAGTISTANTSRGLVYCKPTAYSHVAQVNFESAPGCLLTVAGSAPAIGFGTGATKGVVAVNATDTKFSTTNALFQVNASPINGPCGIQVNMKGCTLSLATGYGLIRNNNASSGFTSNVGVMGLGSYMNFDECKFVSSSTTNKANMIYNENRLIGRYFGTVSFNNCEFTRINFNFDQIYSFCEATTGEDETVTYNTNFPYYDVEVQGSAYPSGDGADVAMNVNCQYDYRGTLVNAGWDVSKQVSFDGKCSFTNCSTTLFNDTASGFNMNNVIEKDEGNLWKANEDKSFVAMYDVEEIASELDFLFFVKMANNLDEEIQSSLKNDVSLASGFTLADGANLALDLQGNELAFTATASSIRAYIRGNLHIYSSEVGGTLTSYNSLAMFFFADAYSPTLTLGRESDPRENLTVQQKGSGGIFVFSNGFNSATVTVNVYSATVSTKKYQSKLNSTATVDDEPKYCITYKNCLIYLNDFGILTYNENQVLASDDTNANNGLFAAGSFLNVEDSTIMAASTNSTACLFYSPSHPQVTDGPSLSNFLGRYYGTVSFKNTHFDGIWMNTGGIYSTAENQAQNGVNEKYVIPDTYDVTKQVSFLEGCTFDMGSRGGINAYGNYFSSDVNTTVQEGYVFARTEESDTYAILPEDEAVNITWALEDDNYTVAYKNGVNVYVPTLAGYTVNGNYYVPVFNEEVSLTATEDMTYTTRWSGGSTLSANYTLDTAIDFNAYVPATDEITHINGKATTDYEKRVANEMTFYVVTFPDLAPKDAYRSQLVSLTVSLDGEKVVTVDRYVSLIGYAKAAFKSESTDEKIRDLVLNTLDYINKTNVYFGGESVSQIEDILSENDFTPYVWSTNENVKELGTYENLIGACLDLNRTPGFVFSVNKDYEGDVVVNGVAYNDYVETTVNGQTVKYVVVEISACRMNEDLNVTIGEDSLVYNLDTYISQATAENGDVTPDYASALYGYVLSCIRYIGDK